MSQECSESPGSPLSVRQLVFCLVGGSVERVQHSKQDAEKILAHLPDI